MSPIVTKFHQKLKHLIFMKMKAELDQSIFFFLSELDWLCDRGKIGLIALH